MSELSKHFNYSGNDITFQLSDGDIMVNATEMAKPFGKRPAKWLELPSTINFLTELSNVRKSDNWIITERGQHTGGTWMHEDVALEFSRWLSPAFAIWCNDRIKELLKNGSTSLPMSEDEMILKSMKTLLGRVDQLTEQNRLLTCTIKEQAPKVDYYEEVLQSESDITTTIIAKEMGMSAITLNKVLRNKGVQFRQGGAWVLYAKHQNKGFTKTKTHPYVDSHGKLQTSILTVWTEKGRQFIHSLLTSKISTQPL